MPKELEKNIMKPRSFSRERRREEKEFDERVIEVARISRVVKGGRRIRFRALLVLGDHKGRVGMGVAKANEVADAVKKATAKAKKNMVNVPIVAGSIPHEVMYKYKAAKVLLKPASSGTSIVAGGSVRAVVELAGISDILAKSMGSQNKINNITATIKALGSFNPKVVEAVSKMSEKIQKVEIKPEIESKKIEKAEAPKEEKKEKENKVVKPKPAAKKPAAKKAKK